MHASRYLSTYLIALLGVVSIFLAQLSVSMGDSVALSKQSIGGASVYVITADLGDPSVKVDIGLPAKGISHSEPFQSFVRRRAPVAAVTGTYFDTRTLLPTGSIVVGGKTVHKSHIGTAVCFLGANKIKFVDAKAGEECDLSGAQCAVRTGPRLLAGGLSALNPRREGFRHPGLYGARTRMALGVTRGNTLLLVSVRTPVTFSRLANIMKALGSVDAVCLDGGTSSAMYYKGQLVRRPGRMLTNVIEIREDLQAAVRTKQVAAALRGNGFILRVIDDTPAASRMALRRSEDAARSYDESYEQPAVLAEPVRLRFAKGFHALFPTDRAKLSGLKRLNDA